MEPALESGEIVKKGTAEVIVFKFSPKDVVCATDLFNKQRIKK